MKILRIIERTNQGRKSLETIMISLPHFPTLHITTISNRRIVASNASNNDNINNLESDNLNFAGYL